MFGADWTGYTAGTDVDVRWYLPTLRWLNGTVTAGVSYEYVEATEVDDVSSHDTSWQYQGDLYKFPQPAVNRSIGAGFLQAKLDFLSRFQLTTGARVDRYSDFGTSFNPRAALVYITPFKSDLKIMYGRAFRA